ncbi:MAG: tetratricopeptide repeat protein [Eudoraea sp.]|nr:tetratricopeptide repeat protein [Eudoraea sp.]NNJ39353.1 tetratricopeptide repeat protein [Eudoraea sp.]
MAMILFVFLGSYLQAQQKFTAQQWQEDLRFLQTTIHQDYPFLFKKISAKDFDASVAALHDAIPNLEEHEIMVGLSRIVASIEYGHTVMGYWEGIIPYHQMPLVLYEYNDGIYLQGVHKDYEAILGARLLKIEGKPTDKVLELMRPVVPAENEQFVKAYGIHYLTFPEFLHAQGVMPQLKQFITITLEKEGKVFDAEIKAVPAKRFPRQYGMVVPSDTWLESRDLSITPLYLKNLDKIYYYEFLPESKTVYVRQSQIQDQEGEDIPAFYAKVFDFIANNDVEKLILDLRLNGGGNNYKNKAVVTGIIKADKINKPGKFVVIIGRRTFSACQNLVNELSNYTNAVFVGEPTAENINFYGDNRPVQLPNSKMNAYLSFAWWQDKPQWENADWTAPHIAVDMSFEQYRNNEDPVLQTAMDFSNENFVLDPMNYYRDLFTAGKIEELQSEVTRMIQDPSYRFFDFEGEFNKAGYDLLSGKRYEDAIFVFTMTAELFPDSANAWDSLAEAYWKSGAVDKAKEYYKKALSLDPDGNTGANALRMLKEIASEN